MTLKPQRVITIEPHAWADGQYRWLYAAVVVTRKVLRTVQGAV